MKNVELIFRVYMVEPRLKKHDHDIDIELCLVELNDGYIETKNEFESQEEAVEFLRVSSNIKREREYMIIPSCKVR